MTLWIRTQDKRALIQVDNISSHVDGWDIYTHTSDGYALLGEYSKEQSLKVMDEIQKLLYNDKIVISDAPMHENFGTPVNTIIIRNNGTTETQQLNCIVYEMPQK